MASINGSCKFLASYAESLGLTGTTEAPGSNDKGKGKLVQDTRLIQSGVREQGEMSVGHQTWMAPKEGWIKLNTDAGFVAGEASARIVARNAEGEVLLSAWRTLRHCSLADEAEAEACLEGLRLMTEWIKQSVCVESDCLNLVRAMEKKEASRSSWDGILLEIQAVSSLLQEYNVRHIRREANTVAHRLAQEVIKKQQQCVVMRLRAPPWVQDLVRKEAPVQGVTDPSCNSVLV
jgi:ribonuclease HI